ncbi:uncharacterized protein METZ01_LOCUS110883, partial [marine metagenome]
MSYDSKSKITDHLVALKIIAYASVV